MNRKELEEEFLAALTGAGQSATMEFGDEAYGGLRGGYDSLFGDETFGDAYKKRRDEARGYIKGEMERYPIAYGAGDIAGSMLPIPGLGQAALAKSVLQRAGKAAIGGGLSGLGRSEGETAKEILADTASGAASSAGMSFGFDQMMRRIGDVIDFKKMKDRLKAEKIADAIDEPPKIPREGLGARTGEVREFKDKNKQIIEDMRRRDKMEELFPPRTGPGSLSGNLGKPSKEMMAENNRRAMKEAKLDHKTKDFDFPDEVITAKAPIDKDLNIARNKVEREYEKIIEGEDYGGGSYWPSGKFKEVPPSKDMSFTDFAKAIEQRKQYNPEDAMSPLERDRWDIFRAQANMANKAEDADRLQSLAGRHIDDEQISRQISDLRKKSDSWKERSEEWSDDLDALQKRIDAGEKIPGVNRPELTFDEEAMDFAKRAGNDGSFDSEKEAEAWYRKQYSPEALEKKSKARDKKDKNEKIEREFRRSDEFKDAQNASWGRDEVTWPRRDVQELEGPVKFTGGRRDNKLSIADPNTPRDWESYAMALERGDRVRTPLEALSPEELERFQLFASQAKALDQMDFRDALLQRMKKGGDLHAIKNRKILKNVLERLNREAARGMGSFERGQKRDPWNAGE